MGIKTYQKKNARAKEKELAESDIPVKRKIQKTIRKYHFPPVCRIELILFPLLLYFSPDRFQYPYIKFTTTFFWPYNGEIQMFKSISTNQKFIPDKKEIFSWLLKHLKQRKNTSPLTYFHF